MLDAKLPQALDVLEQIGVDVTVFVVHEYFFGFDAVIDFQSRSRHTGSMPGGSLANRPKGFQASCGP
jgi:hypothetical protein